MKLRDRVMRLGVPLFVEAPANRRSFADLRDALARTAKPIEERFGKAKTPQATKTIRHIIGMERWGQRRLRVALGEPLVMDGHHAYKPQPGLDTGALIEEFRSTRQQTLELIQKLESTPYRQKIPHNALGPLSLKGWLFYLNIHADWESRKLG